MNRQVRVFDSFDQAEAAEAEYYASLSPDERLSILLEIIERHRESLGQSEQGFERVYRVTELSQS